VEVARTRHPDLVLLDVAMPGIDGWEATRRIHGLPGLEQLPIIAVSARVAAEDRAQSLAAGACGFVAKPVHHDELLEHVGRALALAWVSEVSATVAHGASRDGGQPAGGSPSPALAPDEARQYYELARRGWLRDLLVQLDDLERREPHRREAIAPLYDLARRYRGREIEQWLGPYLSDASDGE